MGEPLARLPRGRNAPGLWSAPAYRERGYAEALQDVWVRTEIVPRLERAARALEAHGHGLLLWDGWRPPGLQRVLYERYRADLAVSTGLRGPELEEVVARFVTDPERRTAPPAHVTGGAVDLTLCDPGDGTARDMGGEFDELSERSLPGHHDGDASTPYAARRAALREAMAGAGFVQLPTEWWHFEYGTDLWARACGEPVRFGPAEAPRHD
jgi:D-alanyl-D-alanine dipeptidase